MGQSAARWWSRLHLRHLGYATIIWEAPHVHRAVKQQKKEHMRPRRDDWENVQTRGSKYAEKSIRQSV